MFWTIHPALVAILAVIFSVAGLMSSAAPTLALSPDRGLELVTPEAPGPAITNVEHISADGKAVIYQSLGAFPDAEAGDLFSYNLTVRGPDGWVNRPISPPFTLKQPNLVPTKPLAFDESLTTSLWQSSLPLTPDGPEAGKFSLYRRFPDGSLQMQVALGEPEPSTVGASSNSGHLVFRYSGHLLASDVARTSGSGIYELVGSTLRQVDVGPGGQELSPCGAEAGSTSVSQSGERIVFSARLADCSQPRRVYVREGGSETIEVSESECTRPDCDAPQNVTFVGATPSVSNVFMVTSQQLTSGDEDDDPDLYRRDLAGGELKLLTPDSVGADGEVLAEPVYTSTDGSRVYLYARGRLTPGIGGKARTNLYLSEANQLRFIASLGTEQPFATSASGRYALLTTQTALSGNELERPFLFEFDGSDSTAGRFGTITRIGIDESAGHVYVLDNGHDVVDKFNAEGDALPFASTGTSSLSGAATPAGAFGFNGEADISIDNSGAASHGRLYVNAEFGPVNAFGPDGSYLWQLPAATLGDDCGTAVDALGHLWVADWSKGKAFQYAATGSPPAQIGAVESTTGNPCRINLDRQGNVYLNIWNSKVDKYMNGLFASTLDSGKSLDVAIDQSENDGLLFTIHEDNFNEYSFEGGLVGTSGDGVIERGVGIAYSPQRDWVYVADGGDNTIKVFGPPAASPATDVPIEGLDLDGKADVYRYDALLNRLKLVSVGPNTGNGPFDATTRSPLEEPQFLGPEVTFRVLSEDGQRAWFSTPEQLLPEDGNDAEDLYEWHLGDLHLVSDGQGPGEVMFAGASPDGSTVMFRTTRVLLSADRDGGDRDVYAARIGGGFEESAVSPECPQQPCQRSPTVAGLADSPATIHMGESGSRRLRIRRFPGDMVAKIIRSGRTRLIVQVPAPGVVSAKAFSRKTLLAKGIAGATKSGPIHIVLKWTTKARAQLKAGRTLMLRLQVREGATAVTRRLTLKGVN